jgi:PAS domain S-box-containing protein
MPQMTIVPERLKALYTRIPDRVAVYLQFAGKDDVPLTYEQLLRGASSVARTLARHNVQPGDVVVLILQHGVDLIYFFWGAILHGAIPSIMPFLTEKLSPERYQADLSALIGVTTPSAIVTYPEFKTDVRSVLRPGDSVRAVIHTDQLEEPAELDLDSLAVERAESDIALLQHSSGTTGLQKGVALSHQAIFNQLDAYTKALALNEEDVIVSWLPLYHDMGLIACFMLPLVCHLPIVMQSPTEWVLRPRTMLQLISAYRCTLAWIPNFALQFLARRVGVEQEVQYDLSSVRALINCSEPIRARSLDEFYNAYKGIGITPDMLQSSYAMAENVFAVTQSDIHHAPKRLWISAKRFWEEHLAVPVEENAEGAVCFVTSGRCLPGNRIRIASSDGADLADGHVGEILINSDSLFDGYYNRPEITAEVFQDGWYRSGDLGFSLNGELYVIGRAKDLIIVAGKNIYPQDIEEIVCNHPAIHDGRAVAFGLYNPDQGTEDIIVVAEAETDEHLKAAADIEAMMRNAIVAELDVVPRAIYLKPPKWIVKSTAGKPARSITREKLLLEHPELVGKEHEYLFELVNDSVMTRTIGGRINFWNRRAEDLYGWKKEEAIGQISHVLLRTQFPEPLEQIESELIRKGRWQGKLVHNPRDGRRIVVESRWVLELKARPEGVVEINSRCTSLD